MISLLVAAGISLVGKLGDALAPMLISDGHVILLLVLNANIGDENRCNCEQCSRTSCCFMQPMLSTPLLQKRREEVWALETAVAK